MDAVAPEPEILGLQLMTVRDAGRGRVNIGVGHTDDRRVVVVGPPVALLASAEAAKYAAMVHQAIAEAMS